MNLDKQKKIIRIGGRSAFTLTEVIVYVGILSIIILALSGFVLWSVRSNAKAKAIGETSDSARRAMEAMAREIKAAKSIYTPTTTASQLSLETTRYLPQEETTTYLDFYLCDGRLCLKKESQNPLALTSGKVEVTALNFEIIGVYPGSVKISLTVNYKNPNNRPEYESSVNLISTVSLRSY